MKLQRMAAAIVAGTTLAVAGSTGAVLASSHMDAPLITLDDPANTTDVYAFRSQSDDGDTQYLTTALAVYPFEEPGIGPNNYRFDDRVLYTIHVALGDDLAAGRPTVSYEFRFKTAFVNKNTTLQAFLGEIGSVFDANQNLRQTYSVTKVDRRSSGKKDKFSRFKKPKRTLLGKDLPVPPNNQGQVTRFYNQGDDGDNPAKEGVRIADGQTEADLDVYTRGAIHDIKDGYRAFAGQRDDGFYADIQAIFDFNGGIDFGGPNKPFDSQGGYNVHTLALNIPLDEFEGETVVGVYATTSRQRLEIRPNGKPSVALGSFVQTARQGNPLFAEALVALVDKDRFNVTPPSVDQKVFRTYAENVELAAALGLPPADPAVFPEGIVSAIFIPDLIKVNLTTGPARVPNDPNFDRLSGVVPVLTGVIEETDDVLYDADGNPVFGGWPNGRRFGDDVVDIALFAIGLPLGNPADGVTKNDITYNDVFPYAATPLNGRNHPHHGEAALTN